MAERLDQVGAAVPLRRPRAVGLELGRTKEERAPDRERHRLVERKSQARAAGSAWPPAPGSSGTRTSRRHRRARGACSSGTERRDRAGARRASGRCAARARSRRCSTPPGRSASAVRLGALTMPNGVSIARPPAYGAPPGSVWQPKQLPARTRYSPRATRSASLGRAAASGARCSVVVAIEPDDGDRREQHDRRDDGERDRLPCRASSRRGARSAGRCRRRRRRRSAAASTAPAARSHAREPAAPRARPRPRRCPRATGAARPAPCSRAAARAAGRCARRRAGR